MGCVAGYRRGSNSRLVLCQTVLPGPERSAVKPRTADLPRKVQCRLVQRLVLPDRPSGQEFPMAALLHVLTLGGEMMAIGRVEKELQFDELKPGDRIEVEHLVTVGQRQWSTKTAGTVVRTERRRHGLHFRRNVDDKVFSDVILLELPDGELTTVTLDEFTALRPA